MCKSHFYAPLLCAFCKYDFLLCFLVSWNWMNLFIFALCLNGWANLNLWIQLHVVSSSSTLRLCAWFIFDLCFRDLLILMMNLRTMFWNGNSQAIELRNWYVYCNSVLFAFVRLQCILIPFLLLFFPSHCSLCSCSSDFFSKALLLKELFLSISGYVFCHCL